MQGGVGLCALLVLMLLEPLEARAQSGAAEVLVERAVAAYKQGDYAKAGAFFLEAYELSKAPAQLRNAAKAYQKVEDFDRAEALWQQFAAIEGIERSERSEAEAQIALIEERRRALAAEEDARRAREETARAKTSTAAVAPPPVTTEAPGFRLPVGPIVTLAAGIVVGIVGGGLYYHTSQRLDRLDDQLDEKDDGGLIVGINQSDAEFELEGINNERRAAVIVSSVAGAVVFAGAVWWLLDLGSSGPIAMVSSDGATLSFAGSW